MRRAAGRLALAALVFCCTSLVFSQQGSQFDVDTPVDTVDANPGDGVCADANGDCSLRAAVMEANASASEDMISLPAGLYALTRTTGGTEEQGSLSILHGVSIVGQNPNDTIIDQQVSTSVININTPTSEAVSISGVTVTGADGINLTGGISVLQTGHLLLHNVDVSYNISDGPGGIWVGSAELVQITNSTIHHNTSLQYCGGLLVEDVGFWKMENVTVAHNSAGFAGGGLCSWNDDLADTVFLQHLTVTDNTTTGTGGGFLNLNVSVPLIGSSIFARNTADGGGANCAAEWDATTVFVSMGLNVFDQNGCANAGTDDVVTDRPIVGTFGLHAPGTTRTVKLAYGSPAIDLLNCTPGFPEGTDQRGIERPQGLGCDSGAFELETGPEQIYTVNYSGDANVGDSVCADTQGRCSLRAALMEANALGNMDEIVVPAGTYVSTLTTGATVDSFGDFDIFMPLYIHGETADATIISSGIVGERVLEIDIPRIHGNGNHSALGTVYITDLSLTGGSTSENGGGLYVDSNDLVSLYNVEVAGNTATNGGGVWIERAYAFWTQNSTYAENTATDSCGGLYVGEISQVFNAANVTVANNQALTGEGGGLCFGEDFAISPPPSTGPKQIVLNSLTITGNSAGTIGGGILNRVFFDDPMGAVMNFFLIGSLFAGNTAGISGDHCALAGAANIALNSLGWNVFDGEGCSDAIDRDVETSMPGIGTLALHAPGQTRTINLLPGSPAVDALPFQYGWGDLDQRGVHRPSGYGIDIGAYELTAPGVMTILADGWGLWLEQDWLDVSEDGETGSFYLIIGSQPQGTVRYTFSDPTGDLSFDPPYLEFDAETWDDWVATEPVKVTVNAVDDIYFEGLETVEVIFTVSGTAPEYAGIVPIVPVPVKIADNDSPALIVTPSKGTPLSVGENGETASFDISLNGAPSGTVTVDFGGLGDDLELSAPSVEFDATNWDEPVTITVSAIDDSTIEGSENAAITFTVGGTSPEFSGVAHADLAVSIADNDEPGDVIVTPVGGALLVRESGSPASAQITFVLTTEPSGTIIYTPNGEGELHFSPEEIAFDADNWDQVQTLHVSAIDDALLEDTEIVSITFAPSGTATNYEGVVPDPVSITVSDDESAVVEWASDSVEVPEDVEGGEYTIDLILDISGAGGSLAVPVSMTIWVAQEVNAEDGVDYTLETTTVSFPAGSVDGETRPVTFGIVDDEIVQGEVAIRTATIDRVGPTSISVGSSFWLTIVEDEPYIATNELLKNGGWESGSQHWQHTLPGTKLKCGGKGFASDCALMLKPANPKAKTTQIVEPQNTEYYADSDLEFSFDANVKGSAKLGAIVVVERAGGELTKVKLKPKPVSSGAWASFDMTYPIPANTVVIGVRVEFKHGGPTGKIFVDNVSLVRAKRINFRLPDGTQLPMPAPDGFRGSN